MLTPPPSSKNRRGKNSSLRPVFLRPAPSTAPPQSPLPTPPSVPPEAEQRSGGWREEEGKNRGGFPFRARASSRWTAAAVRVNFVDNNMYLYSCKHK
uniref:Uncharacterized protein n=1 Tax=Leersia perrieri TaxID=77586 RepID=A0A0D9WHN3_9ORYZ